MIMDRVIDMIMAHCRTAMKLVGHILALSLRHTVYDISTEYMPPLVTMCVEPRSSMTQWSPSAKAWPHLGARLSSHVHNISF